MIVDESVVNKMCLFPGCQICSVFFFHFTAPNEVAGR